MLGELGQQRQVWRAGAASVELDAREQADAADPGDDGRQRGGGVTYPDSFTSESLPGAQIVTRMPSAKGTLFIGGHSRPHCGLFPAIDGLIGLCAMPDGGASGQCLRGTGCCFKGRPIVPLHALQATRVYYNGCTTAGTTSGRQDLLAAKEMIAHAILCGAAREYVGNLRAGRYTDLELSWFAALSAHGVDPADCVRLVEGRRGAVGTERLPSLIHIGDVLSPPWPVSIVDIAPPLTCENELCLEWSGNAAIKTARIADSSWLAALRDRRATATIDGVRHEQMEFISNPWQGVGYLMFEADATSHIKMTIVDLDKDQDADHDRAAAAAREALRKCHIRLAELIRYPAFRESLPQSLNEIEELVLSERSVKRESQARQHMTAHGKVPSVTDIEAVLRRTNAHILSAALKKCASKWSWQDEYLTRTFVKPEPCPGTCPSCGGLTTSYVNTSLLYPHLRRITVACGICGIVADQPDYGLRFELERKGLVVRDQEFSGFVRVENFAQRARDCLIASTVRGAQSHEAGNSIKAFSLAPRSRASVPFLFLAAAPIEEVVQCWVMIACEGDLGFAGRISAMATSEKGGTHAI